MYQIRKEERKEKDELAQRKYCKLGVKKGKKRKHKPAAIHQGTQEKLTHVCSEHPELPVNSEVVMYLSHPFGPHSLCPHRHTATLYSSYDFGNINITIQNLNSIFIFAFLYRHYLINPPTRADDITSSVNPHIITSINITQEVRSRIGGSHWDPGDPECPQELIRESDCQRAILETRIQGDCDCCQ